MINYEIAPDITEQRRTYLQLILGITVALGIPFFAIELALQQNAPAFWIAILVTVFISNSLCRIKYTKLASWVYLIGILAALVIRFLGTKQLDPNIYFFMIVPILLSTVLISRDGLQSLTVLTILTIFISTAIKSNIITAFSMTAPAIFTCVIAASIAYANVGNVMEMIYWAMDSQKKDANRAEAFYQQSEQLQDALLKLTHAHSKLELLNKELADEKRKVEQISRAKSTFLSNMSHELRTPLNVVIGYTSSMLTMPEMYNGVELSEHHRKDVQLIKENGQYLVGLINDILDLSKIEAGKIQLRREAVELVDVLKGVVATSKGLVKDKLVQVKLDFPDQLPMVWADALRVRQIMLNLMSNAIKFTDSGSVTLSARLTDTGVRVAVTDTGIGIPEHALAKIFDRFQQAEADTDKLYGGTGLGLDISKQLAIMHGGDLSVESTVGMGSTFSFTLPLATEAQIADAPQSTSRTGNLVELEPVADEIARMYTVLLAESEASTRETLRLALERAGYVVIDTHDGAQVFELALGLLPNIILLDTNLSNASTSDILHSLKSNTELMSIPVVVCCNADSAVRAVEPGAAIATLRKPVKAEDILKCIHDILVPVSESTN